MKTTPFQLLHRIMQFVTIISMIYCIGCSNVIDDMLNDTSEPPDTGEPSNRDSDVVGDQWIIADLSIKEIELLITESKPVQVTVEVIGYLPDSCTVHHETHQAREGNTITIQMTTKRPKDSVCATVVTEYQEQVFIGTFPAGDYKVVVNGVEQKFRVD